MRRASGTRKAGEIWLGNEGEASLRDLLLLAREMKATDVHILAGSPVYARVDGALTALTDSALTASTARHLAFAMLGERQQAAIGEALDLDLMVVDHDQHRYRLNVGFANGAIGAVVRLLPRRPVPLESLRLPAVVEATTHRGKGLVLITGSTSQGKTTTMASMVDAINRHSRKHIVTIEDPIEYVHEPAQSLIRQREVGRDTQTFASGLRAALRQDPDVVLIGEMRDYDTIEIALRAAASGMLVISTLHIVSVERLMDRLLSYAPPGREPLIRTMASEVLHLIVHQELLPTTDGGKRVASEVLVGTRAVRNMLKTGADTQLRQAILSGRDAGMVMMQQSLDTLLGEGTISEAVYQSVSRNYAAVI
jgi:twitching motility protein PilT